MVASVVHIENKLQCSQGLWVKALDSTWKIVSSRLDDAGPLERIFPMLVERHANHDKGLELADEMRRGLLKVALADSVRAFSSEKSDPDMLGFCIPANILDQTQLENFRIMCIEDDTIGHLEVSRISNFLCPSKMQHRRGLARLGAKCSDGGVAPAFVITRGWKRAPPAVPYFAIAAHLNDCVYALMRESRETVLFE